MPLPAFRPRSSIALIYTFHIRLAALCMPMFEHRAQAGDCVCAVSPPNKMNYPFDICCILPQLISARSKREPTRPDECPSLPMRPPAQTSTLNGKGFVPPTASAKASSNFEAVNFGVLWRM